MLQLSKDVLDYYRKVNHSVHNIRANFNPHNKNLKFHSMQKQTNKQMTRNVRTAFGGKMKLNEMGRQKLDNREH